MGLSRALLMEAGMVHWRELGKEPQRGRWTEVETAKWRELEKEAPTEQ